jgi:hypothetical protein
MSQRSLPYESKFDGGTRVRVASRATLEAFLRDWKYHHQLEVQQLSYAGRVAEVESVGFYHGGDVLYTLKDIPRIWHAQCPESP